jgi:uncharacterized membrane protein
MDDEKLQSRMARLMVGGTLLAAGILLAGLVWFLVAHPGLPPGDHVFRGEPKYFENPLSMLRRAVDGSAEGHRRSLIMIGVALLLINPVIRVGLAAAGFLQQGDRLYAGISLFVLAVLVFSFFW